MMDSMFGRDWESNEVAASAGGAVKAYTNTSIGTFWLTADAARQLDNYEAYKFLSAIYQTTLIGKTLAIHLKDEEIVPLSGDLKLATADDIDAGFPENLVEKQSAILRMLYSVNSNVGERIWLENMDHYMFYSKNVAEMGYLLQIMNNKGLISLKVGWTGGGNPTFGMPMFIDEAGWLLIEDLMKHERSRTAFVAMWFDPGMEKAFQSVSEALLQVGFQPLRIDKKHHNNEISGEILYEIRRSRFLVADVTGQRHGVYFEAGYALGRGMPVIWSCKKSELADVHFDTRQYNHVVWEDENDLRDRMVDRIKGTILD